jgi:hypothetical protein
MDHPRARVMLEERGQFLPGWLLRYLFRPFIQSIIRKLEQYPVDKHSTSSTDSRTETEAG